METVTVSPKFQVVIPKAVREAAHLEVGQKLQVIPYGERIELVPICDVRKARGFLRGIDTKIEREGDRG